jgi:hypothetical protein
MNLSEHRDPRRGCEHTDSRARTSAIVDTFRVMERRRENPATNFLEDDAVDGCCAQKAAVPHGGDAVANV